MEKIFKKIIKNKYGYVAVSIIKVEIIASEAIVTYCYKKKWLLCDKHEAIEAISVWDVFYETNK